MVGPESREEAARLAYERAAADQAAEEGDAVLQDSGTVDDPAAQLSEELAAAVRQRDEYLDALRRERAEFENFRKRTTKERMDALDRGAEGLLTQLLGVLDNFGLALGAAEQAAAAGEDALAKGVQMVHAELVSVLQAAGLEEVPGVGAEFDPTVHEAVAQVAAEEEGEQEVTEPVVVEVLRPGYRFKGRVLRPAAVKVAR